VLTLLQTGKRDMIPVVFLDTPGGHYWEAFEQFIREQLLAGGTIDADDLSLLKRTDRVEEAVEEILGFFRVYHSMRYVRANLVFRLNQAPGEKALDEINDRFADILTEGRFAIGSALPEEKDEPELADLPRLIFRFDRQSHGRLRQLIDFLNRNR
jgi:hypothetical protein